MRQRHVNTDEVVEKSPLGPKVVAKPKSRSSLQLCCRVIWIVLLFLTVSLLYLVGTRLGPGTPFPSQALDNIPPILPESALDIVAELDTPPGNIAVSNTNRIFFNFHPEYHPNPTKIAELLNRTSWVPFPSLEFQKSIVTCLSMRIDSNSRLWLLDFVQHGMAGSPTLYAIQLAKTPRQADTHYLNYSFPSNVAGFGSMLNDFQVDPKGQYIYIADTSILGQTPALVVFSIADKRSHRILSSHHSMFGSALFFNVGSVPIRLGPFAVKIHVDSIGLSRDGSTLYFGAVTGTDLYSVPTAQLRATHGGATAREEAAASQVRVETVAKPVTDGLSVDGAGNVWLTAFALSALAVAVPGPAGEARLVKVVQSESLLRWPDGLSFGPDGLYVTNSALHLHAQALLSGQDLRARHGPFHILRLPAAALRTVAASLGQRPDALLPTAGQ